MKNYSLRDVIGPIMIGPSSSHTAGVLAIAAMARELCGGTPKRAAFTLYGSFAHTGRGHGTDKALVAGLLGFAVDDEHIRDAFALAEEAGLETSFTFDGETEMDHPNTVDIEVEGPTGVAVAIRGVSVGGGACLITSIDGINVAITGEHTSVVVRQRDVRGVLAHISSCLARFGVNIATASLYRTAKHVDAYTVLETDDPVDALAQAAIADHPAVFEVRVIAPTFAVGGEPAAVPADADMRFEELNYQDGAGLLELCERRGETIAQVFRAREEALALARGFDADVDGYLHRVLDVMEASSVGPVRNPVPSTGGLIGGEAAKMAQACPGGPATVLDPLAAEMAIRALAVLETNASMGKIVAAPTAGSAGVLPAVLLSLRHQRGLDGAAMDEGLLTAAAVGSIVARNASVSGAEGGCQAEVGTAAAMAAAAACAMAKGTPAQCLAAAASVMMSMLGLVCDPVGGLVEVPCQKRNATAASVALACAQMALAGIENLISFDEAVAVMDEVGRGLPFELRESALGGIAAAPSACAWCKAC